jgi:hypothetical protein
MQVGQKPEFTRKPSKLISRDRPIALNSLRQNIRKKSKEVSESRQSIESPTRPHYLISNLRSELTNLKM